MSELDILLKAVAVGLKAGLKAFAEGCETVSEKADEAPKQRGRRKEEAAPAEARSAAPVEPVRKTRKKRGPKALKPGRKKGTAGRRRKGGVSDTDAVLEVIMAAEKGIDQDELAVRAGFSKSKVHGIVYRLKKQGKIRSDRKGFYEKI